MRLPLQFLELFFFCHQLFLQFTEAKKKNRYDLTECGKKSDLVWSPPMQLLFVGAAPLLPGSGRQTIRFDCCLGCGPYFGVLLRSNKKGLLKKHAQP